MNRITKSLMLLVLALMPAVAMAKPPAGPSVMSQVILFGGFILIFYFLIWRPPVQAGQGAQSTGRWSG